MKKPWFYFKGVRKFVFLYLLFLVLMEGLALVFPLLLKNLSSLAEGASTTQIITSGLFVFGMVILIFVVNFLAEVFGSIALSAMQKNLRGEMFERIQSAPVERINELGATTIMPLLMNDTTWIRNMQKHLIILAVLIPVTILGSIIMLFTFEIYFGLIALLSVPIAVVFFVVNSRRLGKIMEKSIPGFDQMHVQVKEGITGAKEIRIYNKAKQRDEEFDELFWHGRQQHSQTHKSINLSVSFNSLLFSIVTVALVVYSVATSADVTTLIVLNAAFMYVNRLWWGSHEIFKMFVDFIPRIKLAKERIARVYNLPIDSSGSGLKLDMADFQSVGLEMKGVNFKYPNGAVGLTNINMKIEKNSRVAITGGAGSGRTIIPQLLLQYQKPATGKITIEGTDIHTLSATFYRRNMIAYCDQTPEFIPGTMRDNMRLLNPEVSDEEILKLFKDIGAQSFIDKFDSFLDYKICERDGFNMATKKLLNLVRSLLKPAPIYVFNQCFDHINQEYIVKIIAKLKREKKTCIFMTQNNLVSKHCDKVYVLKNGTISGSGTHGELSKTNSDYREIFLASAGRIISEEYAKEVILVPECTTGGGDAV